MHPFYTAGTMHDTLLSLLYRVRDDLPAVAVELILIGLCVSWSAGVLHSTRGTRPLRGALVILIVATVVVRALVVQFGWVRLELLYTYVLYALAFISLVVFQPELRRALIRVGDVRWRRARHPKSQLVAALVKSAGYLSKNRYGALIAIQRGVDLGGWAENGTLINAEVSAGLLNTIFFPNSPLHDLGVIIRGRRVVAANCQFPSPDSDELDTALGSRHLAAIGMSYETDALVLVLSEETGVISLADNGELQRYLTLDDLGDELEARLSGVLQTKADVRDRSTLSSIWRWIRRPLVVVPLTLMIWYLADQATLVDANVDVLLHLRHDDPGHIIDVLTPTSHLLPATRFGANDPGRAGRATTSPAPGTVATTKPAAPIMPTLALTARLHGPARVIDQIGRDADQRALELTWVLPEPYAGVGMHELDVEQVREAIELLRDLAGHGLTVTQLNLNDKLRFQVDRLVTRRFPVRVVDEPVPFEVVQIEPPAVDALVRGRDVGRLPPETQAYVRAPLGEDRLRGVTPGEPRRFTGVPLARQIGSVALVRVQPPRADVTIRAGQGQRVIVRNVVVHPFISPAVSADYEVEKLDENEWRFDVEVTGKAALVSNLQPTDIRAFVLITEDMVPQPSEEPLRLAEITIVPPTGVTVLEPSGPRSVRVRIVPRAGGGT